LGKNFFPMPNPTAAHLIFKILPLNLLFSVGFIVGFVKNL